MTSTAADLLLGRPLLDHLREPLALAPGRASAAASGDAIDHLRDVTGCIAAIPCANATNDGGVEAVAGERFESGVRARGGTPRRARSPRRSVRCGRRGSSRLRRVARRSAFSPAAARCSIMCGLVRLRLAGMVLEVRRRPRRRARAAARRSASNAGCRARSPAPRSRSGVAATLILATTSARRGCRRGRRRDLGEHRAIDHARDRSSAPRDRGLLPGETSRW